jgi:hypothetical protein
MNERHPQRASTGRIVKAASQIHCLQFQNNAQQMLHFTVQFNIDRYKVKVKVKVSP